MAHLLDARGTEARRTAGEKPAGKSLSGLSNRTQKLLFAVLTVILTIATVSAIRMWFQRTDTLIFATGEPGAIDAQFASRLAAVLKSNGSRIRLKIDSNAGNAKALAQFDRRQADLAILRTDAKIPARARAVAILEHDVLLLISPGEKKIDSLAALRKKKIAVVGDVGNDEAFVRKILEVPEGSDAASRVQAAPDGANLEKLLSSGGYGAVIVIAHASKIAKDKSYAQYASKRSNNFTLNKIDESAALARKNPEIFAEKIGTGMLSSSPLIPDDDIETIGLEWILLTRSKLSDETVGELARLIYENKTDLALADGFASKIEVADTDKDALIVAHKGAAEYINDDTKSFLERYSDLLYLGVAALSVIGSLFVGLYTAVTRVAPEKASGLATAVLDVGEKIEYAHSLDALDELQDKLETILRSVVIGLRDGTVTNDGLDSFRLGYEFVRDNIAMRRESLKRHGGHEDNIVSVKTAQGA